MAGETPTILCVDDDTDILEILNEFFTREGYNVVTATNGVEAMFQVQRCLPQAVIIDLFMPRLGGLGALDRIRRLEPRIVIILMSGVPTALDMISEAGVEVAGVFTKPLDFDQLLRTLVQAGVTPRKAASAERPKEPPPDKRPGRKRILVVDDESEVREVLAEYLERKGFEVHQAENGAEALRRLPAVSPHLVFLDITMPGLNGMETLKQIKVISRDIPVIMVSAIEDVDTARQTLALGAADYIPKPVNFPYLDTVLEAHLFMTQI